MADFLKQVNDVVEKVSEQMQEGSKKAKERFDVEVEKAKIRSEIGNTKKDLTKIYEQLGRDFFAAQQKGETVDFSEALNTIRSKEDVMSSLSEKLDKIGEVLKDKADEIKEELNDKGSDVFEEISSKVGELKEDAAEKINELTDKDE